jgi:3-hydroxybutyryl-CoA dehydrogenase
MLDIDQRAVDRGVAAIGGSLDRLVKKEKMHGADKDAALGACMRTTSYDDLADCDVVIEAGDREPGAQAAHPARGRQAREAGHPRVEHVVDLDHDDGRRALAPDAFVGLHFFNPVPMMALVEVVSGMQTSEATRDAATAFAKQLGKTPITCATARASRSTASCAR